MIGGIDMCFGGSPGDCINTLNLKTLAESFYSAHNDIPRGNVSACCYEHENNVKILMFGGNDGEPDTLQNSVLEYNIAHTKSKLLTNPTDSDDTPHCRCHAFTKVINNTMVMYGGKAEDEQFNDMWSFDLDTHKWTELQQYGDVPARYDFCCLISNDRILCVSDLAIYICDLHVTTWKRLQGEVNLNFEEGYRDQIALYYEETWLFMTLRFFCNQQSKEFMVCKLLNQPRFVRAFTDIAIICKN
jgi:hypothetical protein